MSGEQAAWQIRNPFGRNRGIDCKGVLDASDGVSASLLIGQPEAPLATDCSKFGFIVSQFSIDVAARSELANLTGSLVEEDWAGPDPHVGNVTCSGKTCVVVAEDPPPRFLSGGGDRGSVLGFGAVATVKDRSVQRFDCVV